MSRRDTDGVNPYDTCEKGTGMIYLKLDPLPFHHLSEGGDLRKKEMWKSQLSITDIPSLSTQLFQVHVCYRFEALELEGQGSADAVGPHRRLSRVGQSTTHFKTAFAKKERRIIVVNTPHYERNGGPYMATRPYLQRCTASLEAQ